MKVVGDFNNISEELKPPKLKKGDVVYYQYLGGEPNPDKEQKLRPVVYKQSVKIKTRDRIYDPYKKEFVDIGVVAKVDKDNKVRCTNFAFRARANNGLWGCTAGNAASEELYEFLELSNENESNPNRDPSVTPIFKRIDVKKEIKERTKKRTELENAIIIGSAMTAGEMREFAAAMAWNEAADIEVIEDQIKSFYHENPKEFLKMAAEPQTKDKALLKAAFTKGIVTYDVSTHKVLWGSSKVTVAVLERADGKNYLDLFHEWITKSQQGANVLASIKKQIKAEIREAVAEKAEN